jgi:uncharacterized protein YbjT (DUF2867 family)
MGTFLIVGGTGKVGSRLAQILRSAGHQVRVASRHNGNVRFDWRETETYAEAVSGVDGMFLVGPGSATDWSGLLERMLTVAAEHGVRHVVLLSARGVEFLVDGAVARAERVLRAGPVAWTILRPSHFSQNFTEAMFVPEDGEIIAPVGNGAEPFVDIEDLAEVAATVLATGAFENETIEISGPAALTFDQAATIIAGVLGQPVAFVDELPERHVERLRSAGTPEGYITWRMAMLGGIRDGSDAYLSDGIERVLGRPATSFDDWARREVN